jgi:hypothetical protein
MQISTSKKHAPEERGSAAHRIEWEQPPRIEWEQPPRIDGGREGRSHREEWGKRVGEEWRKSGARVSIGMQCGGLGFGFLGETRVVRWCVSMVQMS